MKIKQALVPALVVSVTTRGMKLPTVGSLAGKVQIRPTSTTQTSSTSSLAQKGKAVLDTSNDSNTLTFATDSSWEEWLSKHHSDESFVWIKFAKVNSGIPSVTYPQALDVALCYGWIDSTKKRLDDKYFIQRFTPRRAKSNWSLVNKCKVRDLIASGRMKEAGMAQIEAAKADGRWDVNK